MAQAVSLFRTTTCCRGFSLFELTILIGMAAVMLAISIPMLSTSAKDMQLAADARNIASTLMSAKMCAISQMTHCRVSFDLESNTWSFERLNRDSGQYELQQDVHFLSEGVAHSGISFRANVESAPSGFPTTSSTSIAFNSRGIPIDSGGLPTASSIVYLSRGDTDFAVSASLSGRIQVWKKQEGQWTAQ